MEQYNRHLKPEATDALTVSALEEESKTRKNGPMRFKPELANQRDFHRRAALAHHVQPPDQFFLPFVRFLLFGQTRQRPLGYEVKSILNAQSTHHRNQGRRK